MTALIVRLDRTTDRERPCHANLARVTACEHGPHVAGLRCVECDRHRGFLPRDGFNFITEAVRRSGAPLDPLVVRDRTIGDYVMEKGKYDNTNSGALFKTDKQKESDRDYSGTIDVAGTEFWLSGWVKTSKAGQKYLSLSVKPKDAPAAKPKQSVGEEMDDGIPF